jgi:hypothetical protein
MNRLVLILMLALGGCAMDAAMETEGDSATGTDSAAETDAETDSAADSEPETGQVTVTATAASSGSDSMTATDAVTASDPVTASDSEPGSEPALESPVSVTFHARRGATFSAPVSDEEICDAWVSEHGAWPDGPSTCDPIRTVGAASLLVVYNEMDGDLLLVRRADAGPTVVQRVTGFGDGVNWDETLEVKHFEEAAEGRYVVAVAIRGMGNSCTEPEAYDVRERQLVICEPSFCTRPIPIRRREVVTRFIDPDWTRSVDRITQSFRLGARLTPGGIRITRIRGRIPRRVRPLLGRHALSDLLPDA